MAGRIHGVPHLLEQRFRFLELALVGEDLADVVLRHRDVRHVADALEERAAPLVHVERLRPVALVVRVDAEVVQHGRLPLQVAELLEDRQCEAAERDALGRADLRVHEMQQEVRVAELLLGRRSRAPA